LGELKLFKSLEIAGTTDTKLCGGFTWSTKGSEYRYCGFHGKHVQSRVPNKYSWVLSTFGSLKLRNGILWALPLNQSYTWGSLSKTLLKKRASATWMECLLAFSIVACLL